MGRIDLQRMVGAGSPRPRPPAPQRRRDRPRFAAAAAASFEAIGLMDSADRRACNPVVFITLPMRLPRRRFQGGSRNSDDGRRPRAYRSALLYARRGTAGPSPFSLFPVPADLLLLVQAFGNDLVDRTLHERGRDRFAIPAPGCVMDQRSLILLEVGQQLADGVFRATVLQGGGARKGASVRTPTQYVI
jgi:hypothetical protein